MRSGIKCHASELVRDGRIPSLLVLPEWADPPQPQERPYVPNDLEGAPRDQPSPEVMPAATPSVLTALISGANARLNWTRTLSDSFLTTDYAVYRSVNGAPATLRTTLHVTNNLYRGGTTTLTYLDTAVTLANVNVYTVVALSDGQQVATSNEAQPV